MSGIFSLTPYGQNPIVMDWFQLQDPFTQVLPINIMNNWSGSLWFVGSLNNPPAWYSNYSGIAFSGANAGAVPLTATNESTYTMTWQVSISGASGLITGGNSSPNTDSLSLTVVAYMSGFLNGALASGTVTFSNLLFNRYSGVIKLIGETYNNDQPNFVFQTTSTGTFVPGQNMSYAATYLLSGWESDIGPAYNTTMSLSGQTSLGNKVTWVGASENPTWYFIWRWSGATDLPASTNVSGQLMLDLIAIVSGSNTTYTDNNGAVLQSGFYRGRAWSNIYQVGTPTHYVSPLYSIEYYNLVGPTYKNVFLSKSISGQVLIGPWLIEWHDYFGQGATPTGLLLSNAPSAATSGVVIAPNALGIYGLTAQNRWYRYCIFVSGSALSARGYVWIQKFIGANIQLVNTDDTYIVALS